jgi:hypothetical protein
MPRSPSRQSRSKRRTKELVVLFMGVLITEQALVQTTNLNKRKTSSREENNKHGCWGPSAYEGPQKQDLTVFLEYNV